MLVAKNTAATARHTTHAYSLDTNLLHTAPRGKQTLPLEIINEDPVCAERWPSSSSTTSTSTNASTKASRDRVKASVREVETFRPVIVIIVVEIFAPRPVTVVCCT